MTREEFEQVCLEFEHMLNLENVRTCMIQPLLDEAWSSVSLWEKSETTPEIWRKMLDEE